MGIQCMEIIHDISFILCALFKWFTELGLKYNSLLILETTFTKLHLLLIENTEKFFFFEKTIICLNTQDANKCICHDFWALEW